MTSVRLLVDDVSVTDRLADFGVTRQQLVDIAHGVAAARADATPDDPAFAEGMFAYMFGTRLLRQLFGSIGWIRVEENNVAAVKHPDRPLRVIYQNVDLAADALHEPQACSGKGAGADRVIGQATLFPPDEMAATHDRMLAELQHGAWFFCVSVDGDEIRAELSLPSGLDKGNFSGFVERIFILSGGDALAKRADLPSGIDFEPAVSRR